LPSTFEGSHCVIAKLGYSRDHRPDLQQIVIALMVTPQGSPFYWKVLEGNTQDVTTLPGKIKNRGIRNHPPAFKNDTLRLLLQYQKPQRFAANQPG
jgi:hypothetical protein